VSRREWRVPRRVTALKAAAAVVFFAVAAVYSGDTAGWTVAVVAGALLAAFAVRDLVVPVRLAADPEGVTVVHGIARRRSIPWADVERVRVDVRQRLGRRNELLEIDTAESLYLFSAQELGAECDQVLATLAALRTGYPLPGG
jgi:hypothetical protein